MTNVWKAKEKRKKLMKRQRDRCHWCDLPMNQRPGDKDQATLEHMVPRAKDGGSHIGNLKAAHRECNENRAKMTREKFNAFIDAKKALNKKGVR